MKEKINIKNRHILLILIGVIAAGVFSIGVWAIPSDDGWWTTTGSTGTVDEGDISIYETSGANIYLKSSAPVPSTLDVRYNIIRVNGLQSFQDVTFMRVRYRDNGPSARVIVRLRETNMISGTTTTRMTFDSNKYPQSSSNQVQTIQLEYYEFQGWDFVTNIYYLEANITKTGSSGIPILVGVQLT